MLTRLTLPESIAATAVEEPDMTSGLTSRLYFLKKPPSAAASTGALDGVIETRPT